MAGEKEEFDPLLAPGLHEMRVEELERIAVQRFPNSVTRGRIMENLTSIIQLINQKSIPGDIWIDGSFLTEKLNPDDVDLILIVSETNYRAFNADQKSFFDWFRNTSLYDQYRCDNYATALEPGSTLGEYMHAYWLRQFGFSRDNKLKGLALIKTPFLVQT